MPLDLSDNPVTLALFGEGPWQATVVRRAPENKVARNTSLGKGSSIFDIKTLCAGVGRAHRFFEGWGSERNP